MGIYASAALVSLDQVMVKLQKDHQICKLLSNEMKKEFADIIQVQDNGLTSNMIFWIVK